jgi:predicted nucleotidyltransferase
VERLRDAIPTLSGVWVFGSQATGDAGEESDLDLAVLADEAPDPVSLWENARALAGIAGCTVDLLDLRAVPTTTQYQVVQNGRLLWRRDVGAKVYESFILSSKTALDEALAPLLEEVSRTGRIHGR